MHDLKPFSQPGRIRRRYRSHSAGSMAVEAMLVLPLLIWWYIGSFQFFEAFSERNANTKAAYTLADTITRETLPVNAAYIEGLQKLFDYLTTSNEPTWIRVTSISWDSETNTSVADWSYGTRGQTPHTDATLAALDGQIPMMAPTDTAILVKTHASLVPIFDIGLNDLAFGEFVVMRPRFVTRILYNP